MRQLFEKKWHIEYRRVWWECLMYKLKTNLLFETSEYPTELQI